MEVAWGVNHNQRAAGGAVQRQDRALLALRSTLPFEAWTTWDDPQGPVKILFATPPHIGGTVISNLAPMVAAGKAKAVDRATVNPNRDMVLISQRRHVEVASPSSSISPSQPGNVPLPCVGTCFMGAGNVGQWSIHADAGGMDPITLFA